MKIILVISVLLVLFVLVLPLFVVGDGSGVLSLESANTNTDIKPQESVMPHDTTPSGSAQSLQVTDQEMDKDSTDIRLSVRLLTEGEVILLDLHEYLVGVVAAEMPATFANEALKAQAVAARTYTFYKIQKGSNHNNADVCDDPSCCKAYLKPEKLREKWGDKYEFNIYIFEKAVTDTDGLYIVYQGEPILAVFHSSSAGYTENSENVWRTPLPYLVSVESPEGGVSVPNYNSELQVSYNDFMETVLMKYPEADLSGSRELWISGEKRSESGRIINLRIGGVRLTGTELRLLFGLRSAAVEWLFEDGGIRFKVTGYGHGVGMSQYGANEFAKNGAGFEDILKYYYRDTEIVSYIIPDNSDILYYRG